MIIWLLAGTIAQSPCENIEVPVGMVCIPEGDAVIGSDRNTRFERPEHTVSLSTFFIDAYEVTNAQYAACEAADACPRRKRLPTSYDRYLGAKQPAIPITWRMAHTYCVWAGKRLPTEAEWEKAARGGDARTYPWGDERPSCERAHYKGCQPTNTRAVGQLPAGPYGVYDLAGNGYEWVNDWASPCYAGCRQACGADCQGQDPQGPCGGLPGCESRQQRVLKGGSWYWPAHRTRSSARRGQRPASGLHRFSFRCAADSPVLSQPPYWHQSAREPLELPTPPSPEALETAHAVRDDTDVLKIEACSTEGDSKLSCRDPLSYVQSNEAYRGVFRPYIENLGGAYVGLGADQAYDFIAAARSRWAWLFDYDPAVIHVHHIIHSVLSRARSPREFVDAFGRDARRTTRRWISEDLVNRPKEKRETLAVWGRYRQRLFVHYRRSLKPKKHTPQFGWLASQERYAYIKGLAAQRRIVVRKGNLLTRVALPEIARAARKLSVPIRVYYESNAAEQWPLSPRYRQNMTELPFDRYSVVLRTAYGSRYDVNTKWLYIVHGGEHFQRKLLRAKPQRLRQLMIDARDSAIPHLSLIGLPRENRASISTAGR